MKIKRKVVTPPFEELIPLLIGCWRKLKNLPGGPASELQTREFRSFVQSLTNLKENYDLEDVDCLGAHLLYEFPFYLSEALHLISELPNLPSKCLDLFCGAAPFALAAKMYGAFEACAIDRHPQALRYGAEIAGKLGHTLSCRVQNPKGFEQDIEGKWDLITLGHALFSHYPSKEQQIAFIKRLTKHLSTNGYILFVESSLPQENRKLLALRDALVETGYKIQAPCIWKGNCPALAQEGATCFAQRPIELPYLIKEAHRAAQINRNSLKMSYLIVRHPDASWPNIEDDRLYRVISAPIDTARGKRHVLCGVDGKKLLGSCLDKPTPSSKAYEFIKRGDVISIQNPLETKNDLEITEETELKVVAAISKPLPEVE